MRLASALLFLWSIIPTFAQSTSGNSGTVRGLVQDPSGAVVAKVRVEIENPVSHYSQGVQTDSQGNFVLPNVPFNNYHLVATAPGFQTDCCRC